MAGGTAAKGEADMRIYAVEEMILNGEALPPELAGWRYYRLEYGGVNQDSQWTANILLPPWIDGDDWAERVSDEMEEAGE